MLSKDKAQHDEVLDSLDHRIKTEKWMLHHRILREEQAKEQIPIVPLRKRRTGRLYRVFQSLTFGEHE